MIGRGFTIRFQERDMTLHAKASILVLALALFPSGTHAQEQTPFSDDPPVRAKRLLVYEDFERVAPGRIPRGYQKTGALAVAQDAAHSGRRSLRIEAAVNGPRRITLRGPAVTALGGRHWGRLYFRVQMPAPESQGGGVIHSTLVAGAAQSPLAKDPIEVRLLDTVMGSKGTFQYIYNVQPRRRPEFGKGGGYRHRYTDDWTLAEWHVDHATQTYRLFINGQEVKDVAFKKGAGRFAGAEIPEVFESLSFGWNNYQPAGKGFVAWIDDIALAKERIGSLGIPKKKSRKR